MKTIWEKSKLIYQQQYLRQRANYKKNLCIMVYKEYSLFIGDEIFTRNGYLSYIFSFI